MSRYGIMPKQKPYEEPVLECIVKIPETVKLSVMRATNYGVCGFFL